MRSSFPVATSQSRTVPSRLPEASAFPFGEKAIEVTQSPCPSSLRSSFPVSTSHRRTVWSPVPEASVFPSGEKATDVTTCSCTNRTFLSPISAIARVGRGSPWRSVFGFCSDSGTGSPLAGRRKDMPRSGIRNGKRKACFRMGVPAVWPLATLSDSDASASPTPPSPPAATSGLSAGLPRPRSESSHSLVLRPISPRLARR